MTERHPPQNLSQSPLEVKRLFETFTKDAFPLELRDDYSVADEDGPTRAGCDKNRSTTRTCIRGHSSFQRVTQEGMTVRRVRVVTQPHSPYIQWEHAATARNEDADEQIRWLPRHFLPDALVFPVAGHDWWLFDGRLLAVGHFDRDGRVLGSELVETADVVAECVRVRDLLWDLATPHRAYKP